ncbi:kunitz-type protease inhibitor 1a [Menidia menidia]
MMGGLGGALLLLLLSAHCAAGQEFGGQCAGHFQRGKDDFVLDADGSVKDGATFISAPKLDRYKDCVVTCCKQPRCNVALMERGEEEGAIASCFLFDCLYKKKYVCRFVRKKGYINYMLDAVYERYRDMDVIKIEADSPPVANGGLDRVIQPHDSVTLNGLHSTDDKGIVSFKWQSLDDYPHLVMEETTFPDEVIVSNLSSGMYKFQLTVTDTIGQSDTTKVSILVLTPEQSDHHCMAPMKIGPCRGSFPRWHYNAASKKCEKFTFGGCKENLNNYVEKVECENACSGSGKEGVSGRGLPLPTDIGETCGTPCTPDQFSCANGCCLDPALECDSTPQCSDGSDEQKCEELNNRFRILLEIPVDEQKVRCTEPPETGNCRFTNPKWYYDPYIQDCVRFNYGGCAGNENRFDDQATCKKFCRGVTEKDVFKRKEEYEKSVSDDATGNIVIAAVLCVAILVMLGVLGYCLVKRKKSSQHQRVPVSSAPTTMLEDREHLVYNSTTKPI